MRLSSSPGSPVRRAAWQPRPRPQRPPSPRARRRSACRVSSSRHGQRARPPSHSSVSQGRRPRPAGAVAGSDARAEPEQRLHQPHQPDQVGAARAFRLVRPPGPAAGGNVVPALLAQAQAKGRLQGFAWDVSLSKTSKNIIRWGPFHSPRRPHNGAWRRGVLASLLPGSPAAAAQATGPGGPAGARAAAPPARRSAR